MKISLYTEGIISLPYQNITRSNIEYIIKKTCNYLKIKNIQIILVLCDNPYITQINKKFRNNHKSTDVISFSYNAFSFPDNKSESEHIGEIYISLEKAFENARIYCIDFSDEVKWLIVHGILHLVGYDHEKSTEDEKIMRAKEEEILKLL